LTGRIVIPEEKPREKEGENPEKHRRRQEIMQEKKGEPLSD